MQYISTRGQVPPVSFSTAVAQGLAPDGGLYLPEQLPDLKPFLKAWAQLNYVDLCEAFFALFADDIERSDLSRIVAQSYTQFNHPEIAPIVPFDKLFVLELFHGPTSPLKILRCNYWGIYTHTKFNKRGNRLQYWGRLRAILAQPPFRDYRARRASTLSFFTPRDELRNYKSAK